jgi:hypothetical protein
MIRTVTHLLLSGIYIINGWGAFSKPGGRPKLVAAAGIPQPERAVVLNAAVMIVAGLLLSLGITPARQHDPNHDCGTCLLEGRARTTAPESRGPVSEKSEHDRRVADGSHGKGQVKRR